MSIIVFLSLFFRFCIICFVLLFFFLSRLFIKSRLFSPLFVKSGTKNFYAILRIALPLLYPKWEFWKKWDFSQFSILNSQLTSLRLL